MGWGQCASMVVLLALRRARTERDVAIQQFSHVRACVLAPGIPWVFVWRQLQGDIVPLKYTGNPPIPPANLPNFNGSESQYYLELQLSSYTLMSAVWTFYQAGTVFVPRSSCWCCCMLLCSTPMHTPSHRVVVALLLTPCHRTRRCCSA